MLFISWGSINWQSNWWKLNWGSRSVYSGVAFSSHSGGRFDHSFPTCRCRSARAHQFHSLRQGRSTVAHRVETTVVECSLASHAWTRFPGKFPNYACTTLSAHSDFVGSRVYACFGIACLLHFWQNDRGLLSAASVTRIWYGRRRRVSTQS